MFFDVKRSFVSFNEQKKMKFNTVLTFIWYLIPNGKRRFDDCQKSIWTDVKRYFHFSNGKEKKTTFASMNRFIRVSRRRENPEKNNESWIQTRLTITLNIFSLRVDVLTIERDAKMNKKITNINLLNQTLDFFIRQMNPFLTCHLVQFAFYIIFIIGYIIIFKFLGSKPIYFSFLQWMFSIDCISNENSPIILNFYGKEMIFSENKRFRVLLKVLVIICFYVVTIIFFDGCILSMIIMDPDGECPQNSDSTCFNFESAPTLNPTVFDCPRHVLISSTNSTSRMIICYSWIIKSQSVFGVINQLGICTSILSLLGFTFRCIYRLASWKCWGTSLIILLGLIMLTLLLVFMIVLRATIAYLDFVLLVAGLFLLINALLLVGLVRKLERRAKSNRIEPIAEMIWKKRMNRRISLLISIHHQRFWDLFFITEIFILNNLTKHETWFYKNKKEEKEFLF